MSAEGQAAAKRAAAAPPLTSEEARQQAEAEGLTLLKANNTAGYYYVCLNKPGHPKPYQAQVRRGGKVVSLGNFATAEEAALCIARSPEGRAAARKAAAPPDAAPLTSEEARQQAEARGLTLLKAENATGYFGVYHNPSQPKPYVTQVTRSGKQVSLGSFATAEEAALRVARSSEGRAAAKRAAAAAPPPAAPLTSEEARQQAEAEGLTLLKAENRAGYFYVCLNKPGHPKPYQAQVTRGGKSVHLGYFVTAEEAALCVARSPEGREAAKQAAAAPPPLTSEEAGVVEVEAEVELVEAEEAADVQWAVVEGLEMVEVMAHEVVADAGGRSEGRPKRRRHA